MGKAQTQTHTQAHIQTRTSPQRNKEQSKGRNALLDAGFNLIASHGLQALTLRGIGDDAGCALGTVSYHFAHKDELLSAIFTERVLPAICPHIKPALILEPEAGLRDIIKTQLPFTTELEKLWQVRMSYLSFATGNPKYRNLLQRAQQQSVIYFTTQFDRLIKSRARRSLPNDQTAQHLAVDFLLLLEGAGINMLQVNITERSIYAERVMQWLNRLLGGVEK